MKKEINRRDFLKKSVPISMLPFLIGGFSFRAYGRSTLLETLVSAAVETDRVLVLIQLNGGNDGLNTVIPIDQYSQLSTLRSNILIPENKILKLNNFTGLHPIMTGMNSLWNDEKLSVVQSVGYPNPNFSHFRSTDIWLTASDSNVQINSGWMGRYLSEEYPTFPEGYPNTVMPDPLAIQIGSVISPGLTGYSESMGMAITDPTSFYNLITGTYEPAPNIPAGHELTFIRQVAQNTQLYATVIKAAAAKATNKSTLYPTTGNSLSDQLKIVARLVAGGLKTRIYVVNLGGFDTHSNQGGETGTHSTLLGRLSIAMNAFQDDLRLLNVEDRVLGMTFSEFGRRTNSNASGGTDHGAAAPLFLFGKNVKQTIVGSNPIISGSGNLPMQYDFRSVYATVLKDWFGTPNAELKKVLLKDFQLLPIIKNTLSVRDDVATIPNNIELHQNFPNPFNPITKIPFTSNGSHIEIKIFDSIGKEIRTLISASFTSGKHEVTFNANGLTSGIYYYRLQSGNFTQMKSMMLIK